jgi:hypothetical protein
VTERLIIARLFCHYSTPRSKDGGAMDKRVAQLNIEHYRRLLAAEPEGPKRQTLLRLLAEEEAKPAHLTRFADSPAKKEA